MGLTHLINEGIVMPHPDPLQANIIIVIDYVFLKCNLLNITWLRTKKINPQRENCCNY